MSFYKCLLKYDFKNVLSKNRITRGKKSLKRERSSVPTRFLPLTVSVIVRVRWKLVRLELEETC